MLVYFSDLNNHLQTRNFISERTVHLNTILFQLMHSALVGKVLFLNRDHARDEQYKKRTIHVTCTDFEINCWS
jgi:hypothetical protein